MQAFKSALAVMIIGFATMSSAEAATVTIPVQSGMVVDPAGTSCGLSDNGVSSPVTCEAHVPISLPPGSLIQQIKVIYGKYSPSVGSQVSATVWALNYSTSQDYPVFDRTWTSGPNVGMFTAAPMMAQVGKTFPEAFNVQPQTLYHVDVHADRGFIVSGIEVTYQ